MRVVIASGAGRYADPWHPFAATSACVARILQESGAQVRTDDDVDRAMTALDGVDLLVVNAGDPWGSEPGDDGPESPDVPGGGAAPPPRESLDGFGRALDRGIGVLALHSACASMRDYPQWALAVGRVWLPGVSFHPPADQALIHGGELEGRPIAGFRVWDERYCRLQQVGESTVVAQHDGAAGPEPTAWVRRQGRSRVAVDVLGHDERSYESAGHRALLVTLARWAAARA